MGVKQGGSGATSSKERDIESENVWEEIQMTPQPMVHKCAQGEFMNCFMLESKC